MVDGQVQNNLSLEQIENDYWGDPPADSSTLIATVHRLRRKPIEALSAEDLRVLVAQQVGLDVLVPRTLTCLEREPLLEGDYYPGDVLVAVLQVPLSYWSANPTQLTRLERVVTSVDNPDSELKADIDALMEKIRS
jgi:CDI immunity proteins